MKKILTIFAAFLCTLSTNAQISLEGSTQENPVEIKAGECYLLPSDFSNAYFTYKAEADGLLYLALNKPLKIFSKDIPLPLFGTECVQGVRSGETYTFYNNITWGDTITMTPSFVAGKPYLPLALISTSPTDGSTYRTTQHEGDITFSFNVSINVTAVKAYVELPNGETISVINYRTNEDYNTQGTNYTLQLAETYNMLYNDGRLKEGDSFKVVLSNIASDIEAENVYNGEVSVQLTASGEVVKLINSSNSSKLLSYYMPGDEAGLITLTFTDEVTCTAPHATLAYGDREAGTWTEVEVPYSISGNTITWNVQGIHLTNIPADDEGNRYVSISLKNIADKEGFPIESNAEGTTGTILFSYLIETMDINIYPDFLPAAGSNIDQTNEVEIWISAGKYVTFDGAKVTYVKEGASTIEILSLAQLRQEDDPYSESDLLVYIPIENYPFEAGEVTIELTNVSAANGTNPEIKVIYKSEGTRVNHIDLPIESNSNVTGIWTIEGRPISPNLQPQQRGIYLQKTNDGKVRKVIHE